jgi:hypothetical protein
MNLRGMANSLTQNVNPNISITWRKSTGYETDTARKRIPKFSDTTVQGQVQALSATDLKHVDGLNITGVMRSVYLYGDVEGINRQNQQGGDLLVFPQAPGAPDSTWLVATVVETWPDWCHVIATLQVTP